MESHLHLLTLLRESALILTVAVMSFFADYI